MTDRDTPTTLRAIATMMRMEGYRPDAAGVEAFILDNAANEIERLRHEMIRIADLTERWQDSIVTQVNEIARTALEGK